VGLIGERIDKYEVLSQIGEGGMATVYLGRHVTLGRKVAVKILHPHLSSSDKNRRRFEREARAIEHLHHPNILRIFDFSGHTVERCYIVTEFVEGVTLRQVLEDQGLIPSEVAAIVGVQLSEALAYAHESGVVHRDIKPENIMIRQDGVVKLMDFGIARFLDETNITMTGALVGSPAYMSPEQVLERNVGPVSDLFSLGTVLYQLVTGSLPFSGSNPSIILRNVIDGTKVLVLECNPSVCPALADLVESLLSPDPRGRPTDAREAAEALRKVLENSEVDPDLPEWGLKNWLADPSAYWDRLFANLERTLMSQGRAALEAGEHLAARRAFNRLLALAPEHVEVLAMLSDLPTFHGERGNRTRWKPLAGLFLVAGITAVAITLDTPGDPAPPPPTPTVEGDEGGLDPEPVLGEGSMEEEVLPSRRQAQETREASEARPRLESPPTPTTGSDRPQRTRSNVASAATEGAVPGHLEVKLSPRQKAWADIYIDGRRIGRAPVSLDLAPGPHTLKVTNDYALEYVRAFSLEAGEQKVLDGILLQKRPVTVRFAADPACVVLLEDRPLGTVGEMGGSRAFSDPNEISRLRLACPDGEALGPWTVRSPRPGESVTLPP
jgi:serine/threonine-protein kinase